MATDQTDAGCWVHLFEEDIFGGQLKRLGPGTHRTLPKIESIIVGPGARVECIDERTGKSVVLPPKKIIPDVSEMYPNARFKTIYVTAHM